jgi:hypothetical protein
MATRLTSDISSRELSKRIRAGEEFECRRCRAKIKTVPENWQTGMPLHGAECSVDAKHFWVHWDDAETVRAMRAAMKEIKNKREKK